MVAKAETIQLAEDLAMDKADLLDIVKKAMGEVGKGPIEEAAKRLLQAERADIFPHEKEVYEGGKPQHFVYTKNKSVINMSDMSRPFRELSQEMEHFAWFFKSKGDLRELERNGVPLSKVWESPTGRMADMPATMKATGMSEGVSADGGYLVPDEFMATVIEFATKTSPILDKVWRIPMAHLTMKIPKLVQTAGSYFGGLALYWIEEAASKTSSIPAFDQLTLTAKKLIGLTYLTDELLADSAINVANYVTRLFMEAMKYELEAKILQGTGTGQPLGIIVDPNVNLIPRATAGTIIYDDLIDMESEIDENMSDLTFMLRRKTRNTVRKEKDTAGNYVWNDGYAQGMGQPIGPPTLCGYPAHLTRNTPALGTKGDVVLGELGHYALGYRQDVRVDVSIHEKWTTDETSYRFVQRVDGKPAVSPAFSVLKAVTS